MDTNQHEWEGRGNSFTVGGMETVADGNAQTTPKPERARLKFVLVRVHSWFEKVGLGVVAA